MQLLDTKWWIHTLVYFVPSNSFYFLDIKHSAPLWLGRNVRFHNSCS